MRWCQLPLCVVLQVHQSQVHAVRGWWSTWGGGCGWVLRSGWCWRGRHGAGRCTVVCCTLTSTYVVHWSAKRAHARGVSGSVVCVCVCVLCVNAWVSGSFSTQVWPHSFLVFLCFCLQSGLAAMPTYGVAPGAATALGRWLTPSDPPVRSHAQDSKMAAELERHECVPHFASGIAPRGVVCALV